MEGHVLVDEMHPSYDSSIQLILPINFPFPSPSPSPSPSPPHFFLEPNTLFSFRTNAQHQTNILEIRPSFSGGGSGLSKKQKSCSTADQPPVNCLSTPPLSQNTVLQAEPVSSSPSSLPATASTSSKPPPAEPILVVTTQDKSATMQTEQQSSLPSQNGGVLNPVQSPKYLAWVNYYLGKWGMEAKDLTEDLWDGFLLIILIQIVTDVSTTDFRSRLARDEPMDNPEWIVENQELVKKWSVSKELISHDAVVDYADIVQLVIKKLVAISCGDLGLNIFDDPFAASKTIFLEKIRVPFLLERGSADGLDMLLQMSFILDRIRSPKDSEPKKVKRWVPPPKVYKTKEKLDEVVYREGVIRIFLSSTFRDMQKERDRFFQHGAMQLKEYAKMNGFELVFIDLRWGLTAEDSGNGWVVIRCFESIEKCPYFVCFLGARYGWVPNSQNPLEWHPDTCKRYPFLMEIMGLSVTDYEIQYAALTSSPAASRVFFYFRDEKYALENAQSEAERILYRAVDEKDVILIILMHRYRNNNKNNNYQRKNQEALKQTILGRYSALLYRGAAEFSDLVVAHLRYAMEDDFKHRKKRQSEDQAHYQFMQHRLAGFEGRGEMLQLISNKVDGQLLRDDEPITVLAAQSGIGKSSLMAATVRLLEDRNDENMQIIYHFVGCTNISNYVESISTRFWENVIQINDIGIGKKDGHFYSSEGIDGLLNALAKFNQKNTKIVFVVDAVNQLLPSQETPAPHLLTWLPKKAPKNIAIVASTIDTHESSKTAVSEGLSIIPVTKLTIEEISQATTSFLSRYDKKITPGQLEMILSEENQTGHPLYLRILLDELRVFGVYEKLDEEIQTLLQTVGVIELYTLVISRWEKKFNAGGKDLVSTSMKVLFVSRIGLSESELDEYLGIRLGHDFNLAEWKGFFFTLAESLFVRNGRYMYFHQLLIKTVEMRFFERESDLLESMKEYAMWLYGIYAQTRDTECEVIAEICFQLLKGGSYDALVEYLRKDYVVEKMLTGRYRYEFFNAWRVLREKGVANHKEVYSRMATQLTDVGSLLVDYFVECQENSFLISVLLQRVALRSDDETKTKDNMKMGIVYKNIQNWTEAGKYFNRCLDVKKKSGSRDILLASIYDEMGEILMREKKYEEAHQYYNLALEIREAIFGKNHVELSKSFDNLGRLELTKRKKVKALELFNVSLEIRTKSLGDKHPLVAISFTNIGRARFADRWSDEALDYYQKSIKIYESSFGKQHPTVASCLMDIAAVYVYQNKVVEALQHLEDAVKIATNSLGENHPDVVSTWERIGDIQSQIKKYVQSLGSYNRTLEVRKRTLVSDHHDIAKSLENVARINFVLESRHQLLDYFEEAVKIRKATGTEMSLSSPDQCEEIAKYFFGLSHNEIALYLWMREISVLVKRDGWKHLNTWTTCNRISNTIEEKEKHTELLSYWEYVKNSMTSHLSGINDRVWAVCKKISQIHSCLGKTVPTIAISEAKSLIQENIGNMDFTKWTRKEWIDSLLSLVYMSRSDESKSNTASSAMTALCYMGHIFNGCDFSGVRIPHADMSLSVFSGANFADADLEGARFTDSIITGCCFDRANMRDVQFGRLPVDILKGHSERVNMICIIHLDSGEKWVATASADKMVKIWALETGKEIRTLGGSSSALWCVCTLRLENGVHLVVSGSSNGRIFVWNVVSGQLLYSLNAHQSSINFVCPLKGPNGQAWIASASDDWTANIYSAETGALVGTLPGHREKVWCVASITGPRGEKWVATGCCDHKIRVFELTEFKLVKTFTGHTNSIYCICPVVGPDDECWIASSSKDNSARIWCLDTDTEVMCLNGHDHPVTFVNTLRGPNGEVWLASTGHDYSVHLWDLSNGTIVKVLYGHTDHTTSVVAVTNSMGKTVILSSSRDTSIRLWDLETRIETRQPPGHQLRLNAIVYADGPCGEHWVVTVGSDGLIFVWDADSGEEVRKMEEKTGVIWAACTVKGLEGKYWLATGHEDASLYVWDLVTGKKVTTLYGHAGAINCLCSFKGPNNEAFVASGSGDCAIIIWNMETLDIHNRLYGHNHDIYAICHIPGPNGECYMASGGCDYVVLVWDVSGGAMINSLRGHEHQIYGLAHVTGPNDECWLASGSKDTTIRIWNPVTGSKVKTFRGHSNTVAALCGVQGPNGEAWLASGSHDDTVRIWDLKSHKEIDVLYGHTTWVASICYRKGPNGEPLLITGACDKSARVWTLKNAITEHGVQFQDEKAKKIFKKVYQKVMIIGPRLIQGDRISIQGTVGLSQANKQVMFQLGAVSSDADFVNYCESESPTKFQSLHMAYLYKDGVGVEQSTSECKSWAEKAGAARLFSDKGDEDDEEEVDEEEVDEDEEEVDEDEEEVENDEE